MKLGDLLLFVHPFHVRTDKGNVLVPGSVGLLVYTGSSDFPMLDDPDTQMDARILVGNDVHRWWLHGWWRIINDDV